MSNTEYDKIIKKIQNLYHPTTKEESANWQYKFWKTKPINLKGTPCVTSRIIDDEYDTKYINTVNKVPEPYRFYDFKESEYDQIVEFLNKYYCLNDRRDNKFSFDYNTDYLKWALGNGFFFGIVADNNNNNNKMKIGGIIGCTIQNLQIFNKEMQMGCANFLCVHKKLRRSGIAELLIEEMITRLCKLRIMSGVFATERYIPTPVLRVEYYHRPLNYEKLHKLGFVTLDKSMKYETVKSNYESEIVSYENVKKLTPGLCEVVHELFVTYQDKYNFYQKFTLEEFVRTFLDNNIVSTYVIFNEENEPIDFFSYYKLNYKNNCDTIKGAYMYYYSSNITTPLMIFKYAINYAYQEKLDIFTSTDVMENTDVLFDNFTKLSKGETHVNYNLFNWECPSFCSQQACYISF